MGAKISKMFVREDNRVYSIGDRQPNDNHVTNNYVYQGNINSETTLQPRGRSNSRMQVRNRYILNNRGPTRSNNYRINNYNSNYRINSNRNRDNNNNNNIETNLPSTRVNNYYVERDSVLYRNNKNYQRDLRQAIKMSMKSQKKKTKRIKKFECCVCYTNNKKLRHKLRCKHHLCKKCYSKLETQKRCPLCRRNI